MGGRQGSGDSGLKASPRPEHGPLDGLGGALGFHPQSYPGTMEDIELRCSGNLRSPHNPSSSETPSQPGCVQVGGVGSTGAQSPTSFIYG